jgi:type I restriction-modification system DNA methylase subunit
MSDIDSFREKLQLLISKFEKDKPHYLSKGYPEAQVRIDFINPFFKALGWDIENKAQKPPQERDVIVELSPETTKRPDYNFRINGATKFFIEAKAPSIVLDDVNHILQAKSYAWSTKEVYFVILTDFEEFKLFDASLKPNPRFPNEGLIFDFKYTDYLNNIEKLWELSRERVEQGSLEALLPRDTKSKRLRIPPDKSFLEDLTEWRTEFAKDIHKRNPEFNVKLLNDVVQRLLDRIIFIRIAEDRKIRDRELQEIVEQWKEEGRRKSIMMHLVDLFHEVNDDLNGDIFKRHACETADVDSNLLADIIENLYFPKSRYRFDAIGVELLGSIYERYLGSTIRVTPQRIKVEEKPEVRKAGGVYYTPKYIVDYIVKNTVGKIIEGKTPRQIEKIKILDPACGSGSFLLGAYQCLIDHHLKYYREHPKEAQTLHLFPYWKMSPEEFSIPIHEKAKILRNNIFGVDIDPQAVEITMMSLYLKALEGERGLLPKKQQLLPPLSNNIKCGNSLIGYDIFDFPSPLSLRAKGEAISDDETKSCINPFDWNSKTAGFGEIIHPSQSPLAKGGSKGGFDVVIGNPPYVRQEMLGEFKDYFKNHYGVYHGTADLYAYFIERGVSLLKKGGLFSYIVANKWMRANYGEPLRMWMKTQHIEEIVDFGDLPVFESATTYPCIIRICRGGPMCPPKSGQPHRVAPTFYATDVRTLNFNNLQDYVKEHRYKVSFTALDDKGWSLVDEQSQALLNKLRSSGIPLGEYVKGKIYRGVLTGLNEAFVIDEKTKERLIKEDPKSVELIKPFLIGRDIKRYEPPQSNKYLIFTRRGVEIKKYPAIQKYLLSFKEKLLPKPKDWKDEIWKGRKPGSYKWYEIQDAIDYYEEFEKPKIIVPSIVKSASYAFDADGFYSNDKASIIVTDDLYLLGILNSKVCDFVMHSISSTKQGGYFEYKPMYLQQLPIRTIDFKNPSEKAIHDKLVSLADRMLELHKKKTSIPPSAEREKVEREIAVTDEKIDEIVYELYGITEEERKTIESA